MARSPVPSKTKTRLDAAQSRRADGWQNILSGIGLASRDKRMSAVPVPQILTRQAINDLIRADPVARRVAERLPAEAFRKGFTMDSSSEQERATKVNDELNRLGFHELAQKAWKWARAHGGAGIVLGIDDGQEMDMPVKEFGIRSVKWAHVFDRWELIHDEIETDMTKVGFGLPRRYRVAPVNGAKLPTGGDLVHASRVIRFDGAELPREAFIMNQYWHASMFEDLFVPLLNFNQSHDAAATLVQDFAQAVFSLPGLNDMIAAGQDDLVTKRMQLIDQTRSILRAILIGEGESFDRKSTNVTGLTDILDQIGNRLVAATGMPHNLILGEGAKGGLGSEGETENRDWYDHVANEQVKFLQPRIEQAARLLSLAKDGPLGGTVVKDLIVTFRPLWQMDDKERADVNYTQAQADGIYLDRGVIDPIECAKSRFRPEGFSLETTLDEKTRKAMDEPAREELAPGGSNPEDGGSNPAPSPDQPAKAQENAVTSPNQSLNGAQVTSLVEVINQVGLGVIPRKTGVAILEMAFALSNADAERLMGEVGQGFKPAAPPPSQGGGFGGGGSFPPKPAAVPDKKADGLYDAMDFRPPVEVAQACANGLEGLARLDPAMAVDVAPSFIGRAKDLANGVNITPMQVVRLVSFFIQTPEPQGGGGEGGAPTLEYVRWALCGGQWGRTWSQELMKSMERLEAVNAVP